MGEQPDHRWHEEAASLLEWWRDAGVDMPVSEEPFDWLGSTTTPGAVAEIETPSAPAIAAPPSLPETIEAFAEWRTGPQAPESRWKVSLATPQNIIGAPLMVICDLPDDGEADSGILLGGAPGRLFDRMLAAVGLERSQVTITALALGRPATGQVPAADVAALAEITRHHVSLIAPQRVLLLGQPVSRALFGAEAARKRGHLHAIKHDEREFRAIASYHPRFLLQRPTGKAESWRDLLTLFGGMQG